jgi:hypothetical protein
MFSENTKLNTDKANFKTNKTNLDIREIRKIRFITRLIRVYIFNAISS